MARAYKVYIVNRDRVFFYAETGRTKDIAIRRALRDWRLETGRRIGDKTRLEIYCQGDKGARQRV